MHAHDDHDHLHRQALLQDHDLLVLHRVGSQNDTQVDQAELSMAVVRSNMVGILQALAEVDIC